jgi:hypothetical protein
MIKIVINGDKIDINTHNEETGTTGCTKNELMVLKSIADELCGECKEGAE